ncbi:MAG: lysophospholipid acyltransferase family protein [Candidatus Cloacimonetes bacterium]|nr:1-acyl-sn-glycerol-3-phosphate acyltransferase [Candidatus Cloacimonadota bacterium]MDD2506014.1 lysophospholipid acyltransferase family protein [Candidatus Cloacimonadota bacterium]MDD4147837.1 lysophospholipid acyltransferase family protein [Candidatus Cloacimonadota bacterium]MDD4559231.1 lysophospholipid acyltransferase family protein [Candidatus Cloacimonadota bacterium]
MKILHLLRHLYLVAEYFIRAWSISILYKDPQRRRHCWCRNVSHSAKRFQKALNIKVKLFNEERLKEMKHSSYLLVANHSSYTDIIVLAALEELVFITSVEMGNNPFLGSITRMGGCLFTNRKNPMSLKEEIKIFSDTIAQGFKVVLFPEGTSTNGKDIREFRRSLFQIALNENCPILPVCIKYTHLDGEPLNERSRDTIAWYGDMSFAPHFMKLIGHRIDAEIHFLDITHNPGEKTRQELSNSVYEQMRTCFHSGTAASYT